MGELFSGAGLAVLLLVIAFLAGVGLIAKRYQKVAPNEVLIISGRKRKIKLPDGSVQEVGHRSVKGGGTFVWPIVERVNILALDVMTIEVTTEDAYTKNGVPVIVDSVVVMKIRGDTVSIAVAAERFLKHGLPGIEKTAKEVLGGHLRAICSTLTPEEINTERITFQQKVLEVAHKDFENMGLGIDSFTVKQIRDKHGYMDALGKKSAAEVKRNALIGEAEALEKDALMKQSEAKQAGQTRKAETEAEIAQAEKDRDVKKAQYEAQVNAERARAEQAGPKAEAEAKQQVVEAQTILAEKEAERREKQLLSEKVRPAEAEREALIAKAEGEKKAKMLAAEAGQYELEQEGKGEAAKVYNVGKAQADVIELKGKAEAEAIRVKLLAEAEGWEKRAEAMKKYTEAGMALELGQRFIDRLPQMIEASAKALGAVNKVEIFDFGGGQGNPTGKLMGMAPQNVVQTLTWLKEATGIDLAGMLKGVQKKLDASGAKEAGAHTEETPLPREKTEGTKDS